MHRTLAMKTWPCFHLNWNSLYNSHHVLQETQTVWRIQLLQENLVFYEGIVVVSCALNCKVN